MPDNIYMVRAGSTVGPDAPTGGYVTVNPLIATAGRVGSAGLPEPRSRGVRDVAGSVIIKGTPGQ